MAAPALSNAHATVPVAIKKTDSVGTEMNEADIAVNDHLSLHVVAGDDVANSAERRHEDRGLRGSEEIDQAPTYSRFNHGTNLVIRAIREIRERPAGVGKHLLVIRVRQLL